jgi:hypothetical protein
MRNWFKYQVDSTAAERVKLSRYKRRGEEKREEEKRKDIKTPDPRVGGLIKIFHETLRQKPGYQEAKINGAVLGTVLKARLSELGETEVTRRIGHWFVSTDHFVQRNLNNAGIFGQKFHELGKGPITGIADYHRNMSDTRRLPTAAEALGE